MAAGLADHVWSLEGVADLPCRSVILRHHQNSCGCRNTYTDAFRRDRGRGCGILDDAEERTYVGEGSACETGPR